MESNKKLLQHVLIEYGIDDPAKWHWLLDGMPLGQARRIPTHRVGEPDYVYVPGERCAVIRSIGMCTDAKGYTVYAVELYDDTKPEDLDDLLAKNVYGPHADRFYREALKSEEQAHNWLTQRSELVSCLPSSPYKFLFGQSYDGAERVILSLSHYGFSHPVVGRLIKLFGFAILDGLPLGDSQKEFLAAIQDVELAIKLIQDRYRIISVWSEIPYFALVSKESGKLVVDKFYPAGPHPGHHTPASSDNDGTFIELCNVLSLIQESHYSLPQRLIELGEAWQMPEQQAYVHLWNKRAVGGNDPSDFLAHRFGFRHNDDSGRGFMPCGTPENSIRLRTDDPRLFEAAVDLTGWQEDKRPGTYTVEAAFHGGETAWISREARAMIIPLMPGQSGLFYFEKSIWKPWDRSTYTGTTIIAVVIERTLDGSVSFKTPAEPSKLPFFKRHEILKIFVRASKPQYLAAAG